MSRLKSISPSPLAYGVIAFLLLTLGGRSVWAQTPASPEPPLRHTEPLGDVVADLERYIPARMEQAGVPGLAMALVREGRVAWTAGFGTANRITGTPVTPETVFEVASNSKVVTTYAALRLVDQGKLTLDAPLASSLTTPWLPPSAYADQVTLRHVASHSAGFTDTLLPVDKRVTFEPGSAFSYSGVGFLYMQEAIEQTTGASLDDAAQALVFEPLGMASSSFVGRDGLRPRLANGHLDYSLPLFSFLVPFTGIFLALLLAGMVAQRIRTGAWRPQRKLIAGSAGGGALTAIALAYLILGSALPSLALLIVLSGAVFAAALAVALFLVRKMMARLPAQPNRRLHVVWMMVSVVALLWLSGKMTGPMPRGPSPAPSAVGSLRTTAPDLAAFLAELAAPRLLNEETATQLHTPQIAIDDDFSWGLGVGIQHSEQGEALWQNGMTFGFRSVMAIYPEHRWGVVVLTNSHDGLPVAYDVAARTLGGKAHWSFF